MEAGNEFHNFKTMVLIFQRGRYRESDPAEQREWESMDGVTEVLI